jgi:cardiolipin synthase
VPHLGDLPKELLFLAAHPLVKGLLSLVFSLWLLAQRRLQPTITLSWLFAFLLAPWLSAPAFLIAGYARYRRGLRRRRRPKPTHWRARLHEPAARRSAAHDLAGVARIVEAGTGFPVTQGNNLRILEDAFAITGAIAEAMEGARTHIHFEYYILQPDETGRYFRDLLIRKAKAGVQCRVLVDHVGSFALREDFIAPLRQAGVHFAWFEPVRLTRMRGAHLRNHRKLVIVDGAIAFLGSQNIGNEYLQWRLRRSSWRDTQVRMEGPGVESLQTVFLEDWEVATGERLTDPLLIPRQPPRGAAPVQILPTGPDEDELLMETAFAALVHSAHERITLMTPYLVPTLPMLVALESAVKRGVRVQFLLPERSDQWITDLAARAWFRDLLRSGCEIALYRSTFLHAKVVTIDHRAALIGSANMDERSFHLNFELGAILYDTETTASLVASFDRHLLESRRVDRKSYERESLPAAIRDGFLRLVSPLL